MYPKFPPPTPTPLDHFLPVGDTPAEVLVELPHPPMDERHVAQPRPPLQQVIDELVAALPAPPPPRAAAPPSAPMSSVMKVNSVAEVLSDAGFTVIHPTADPVAPLDHAALVAAIAAAVQ